MKKVFSLRLAALLMVPLLAVSCTSVPRQGMSPQARFHEGAAANVVMHFYQWNSIYVTRPDTRENKFLPLLDRESVAQVLARPDVGHDVAVIVVSHFYTADQELELAHDWESFLGNKGFRRVVLLRAGSSKIDNVDGLIVMHDSAKLASTRQPSTPTDLALVTR
ncbi:MAG: hypothetical protein JWQ71_2426 [Pedosphaera sp.]|nr:hypothetical protein [Pedosphaera sp.]